MPTESYLLKPKLPEIWTPLYDLANLVLNSWGLGSRGGRGTLWTWYSTLWSRRENLSPRERVPSRVTSAVRHWCCMTCGVFLFQHVSSVPIGWFVVGGLVHSIIKYFEDPGMIAIQEGVVLVLYSASTSNSIDDTYFIYGESWCPLNFPTFFSIILLTPDPLFDTESQQSQTLLSFSLLSSVLRVVYLPFSFKFWHQNPYWHKYSKCNHLLDCLFLL